MKLTPLILLIILSAAAFGQSRDDPRMRHDADDIFRLEILRGNVTQLGGMEIPSGTIFNPVFNSANRGYWSFGASYRLLAGLFAGLSYTTLTGDDDSTTYARHIEATNPEDLLLESVAEPNGISAVGAELSYQIPAGPIMIEPGVSVGYSWIAQPVVTAYLKEREGTRYSRLDFEGDAAKAPMIAPNLTIRYFARDVRERGIRVGLVLRAEYFSGRYSIGVLQTRSIAPAPHQRTVIATPLRYEALRIGLGVSVIL